jgi:hypothetical protein
MNTEKTRENHNGSELHRLKPMQEVYDVDLFEYLYKISKPVIRRLSRQIDATRFNVSPDIIESYFWDKMLYIFNKYYGTCSEEHLRARILGGLSTFKNHLLHSAYTERAQFNQSIKSFEDLYEDSNEDHDNEFSEEEVDIPTSEMFKKVWDYMMEKLYPDAQLVFEAIYTPPPFIREYPDYKDGNRITNKMLMDFFALPNDHSSEKYIKELREDVDYWIGKAREDLHL